MPADDFSTLASRISDMAADSRNDMAALEGNLKRQIDTTERLVRIVDTDLAEIRSEVKRQGEDSDRITRILETDLAEIKDLLRRQVESTDRLIRLLVDQADGR